MQSLAVKLVHRVLVTCSVDIAVDTTGNQDGCLHQLVCCGEELGDLCVVGPWLRLHKLKLGKDGCHLPGKLGSQCLDCTIQMNKSSMISYCPHMQHVTPLYGLALLMVGVYCQGYSAAAAFSPSVRKHLLRMQAAEHIMTCLFAAAIA